MSLSEILLLWQHCRFQALFKDFKECSVLPLRKELYHQFVLDMNANGKITHNGQFLFMTKEQLEHYCFEQKRPGTDGVALATIFST